MSRVGCTRTLNIVGALALLVGGAWTAPQSVLAEDAPVVATPLELTIVGGAELNPSGPGRPSPVVVRIFELTEAPPFQAADYTALFERPTEPLKAASIAQEEFMLRPGDVQERSLSLEPQVRFLGVAAAFRDMEHGVWHLTVAIIPGRRNFLLIDLDHATIRLETVGAGHP